MDVIIKKADKLYGILSRFVQYYLDIFRHKRNPQISEKFERVVQMSGELLSEPLYNFLNYIEDTRSNTQKGVGVLTAMRESRVIPSLIFAIEKYEKLIIQLSKKSKVNLMVHMKLSTLRDFKIEASKLRPEEEEEEEEENESEEENQTEEQAENEQPSSSSKKRKKTKSKDGYDETPKEKKRKKT